MNEPSANPSPDEASDQEILNALKAASIGLLYPSESDEPFMVYVDTTHDDVLKSIVADKRVAVQETSVADFFAELVSGENGSRFEQLRRVIESRLRAPRVLRVGEVEVDVYILGRTPGGSWVGLHTVSVET